MKKLLIYFLLMFLSVSLLYFVDSRAENIFGLVSPVVIIGVIIFIFIDNLRGSQNGSGKFEQQ